MQREIRSKNCNLVGTSDLTVVAPIKRGLVPALDTVTYKTRAKRVLRALHSGRALSHEQDLARLLSDAVERVGRIHSVRIVVLEPEDVIVLAATFDGSWEAYVRVVWQKTARLLDLVFCNSEDYVVGGTGSFDEWAAWLNRRQAYSPFLYAPPGLTFDDVQYQRMHERLELRHGGADAELRIARATIPSAEAITASQTTDGVDPTNLGHSKPLFALDAQAPAFRQGVRALAGLYRLADLYPPGTSDGGILLRAAHELLPEFTRLVDRDDPGIPVANERFKDALDWFRDGLDAERKSRETTPPIRRVRQPPDVPALCRPTTIQAGILEPLPEADYGIVLLVAFASGAGMAKFLSRCTPTWRDTGVAADNIAVNLALTLRGLERAGLTEDEIRCLPEAFVQGMQRRAGLLGDVRVNHPSRWRLPEANWNQNVEAYGSASSAAAHARTPGEVAQPPAVAAGAAARVELDAVHAVVQLRLCETGIDEHVAHKRLMQRLEAMVDGDVDVRPLSLQWMHRLRDVKARSPNQTIEHFGFGEGQSDPVFEKAKAGRCFENHVHVGDALVGYGNAADNVPWDETLGPPAPKTPDAKPNAASASRDEIDKLLHNGSFLVVRKLGQDLRALEDALATTGTDRELVLAKMMGRWPARHAHAGRPLVPLHDPAKLNDFHYRADPEGIACPFHAHIRRANPRESIVGDLAEPLTAGARVPTIMRRGMSYGPAHNRDERDAAKREASLDTDRGLVFMAYNASISEQFEVIQRWLSGGNSSGSQSCPSDPFLGVAEPGRPRWFRFMLDNGRVERVRLDGSDALHDEPRPIVRVEWGLYAFAPSATAIDMVVQRAQIVDKPHAEPMPWNVQRGHDEIVRLQKLGEDDGARDAWKAALEDADSMADFTAASIWAAVREEHGGVLDTPYGVLVGRREGIDQVLADGNAAVSVSGYMDRMTKSFGAIFLGRDAGADYKRESDPALKAIASCSPIDTFNLAFQVTSEKLGQLVKREMATHVSKEVARRVLGEPANDALAWDLTIDTRELTDHLLATFCEQWFGLTDKTGHFARGGFQWTWQKGQPPRYPGHFMAPSRWFFQPHPGEKVAQLGADHGDALERAMNAFLKSHGKSLTQPAVVEILNSAAAKTDKDYAARTIIGVIMGFAPTVEGVLRRVLAHWWADGTLGSLRALRALHAPDKPSSAKILGDAVDLAFTRTMQLRTVPDVVWRTATKALRIGDVKHHVNVAAGRIVVLGLSSATQQSLAEGRSSEADVVHAFGGDRSAPKPPTHACPGRDLAMQMMRGFVHALVDSPFPLRPGPIATSINASGAVPPTLVLDSVKQFQQAALAKKQKLSKLRTRPPAKQALVKYKQPVDFWAVGDSWLDDILRAYPDLVTALRPLGYDVVNEPLGHTHTGFRLDQLASDAFCSKLRQDLVDAIDGIGAVAPPRVILLDGGGNDIVQPKDRLARTPLFGMLREGALKADDAIDRPALDAFLDRMRGCHVRVLHTLTGATDVPIVIHAYDHPIPDGRGAMASAPWLAPVFRLQRIGDDVAQEVMRRLIDALNAMVADVAAEQARLGRNVHHLDLTGTLARQPDFATSHEIYWGDELHPSPEGYDVIAKVVAQRLAGLGITPA